jgi:hypothetical protein
MNTSLVQKGTIGIALIALVLLALMVSPVSAKADQGYGGWTTDWYQDYSAPVADYGGWTTDWYQDYSAPAYGGWTTDWYQDYSAPSYGGYSYYTPSYYNPSSFSTYTPPAYQSQNQAQSQSQSQSSTNVNNNVNNNNVIVNVPTQTVKKDKDYDRDEDHDVCYNLSGLQKRVPSGYYEQNGYCYKHISYNPPVYQAPYVSLAAVPYTGLELGPVGTALYWSFLVLWCLVAAYLIVVKRVQNTILEKLNGFLFGSTPVVVGNTNFSHQDVASMPRREEKHNPSSIKNEVDATDEFVLSQINRNRN